MSDENNELECPYFDATIINSPEHPVGFMTWSEGITQDKYHIYFPDGSKTFAKLFMDLQQRFDNNEFTRYAVNRYNEL